MKRQILISISMRYLGSLSFLLSSIEKTQKNTSIELYIIVMKLNPPDEALLRRMVASLLPTALLTVVDARSLSFPKGQFNNFSDDKSRFLAQALLFLQQSTLSGHILYLDVYTIVMCDLDPFFTINLGKSALAGTLFSTDNFIKNRILGQVALIENKVCLLELLSQAGYISSSVLLIDAALWRAKGYTLDLIDFLQSLPLYLLRKLQLEELLYYFLMRQNDDSLYYLPANYNTTNLYYPQKLDDNKLNILSARKEIERRIRDNISSNYMLIKDTIYILNISSSVSYIPQHYEPQYHQLLTELCPGCKKLVNRRERGFLKIKTVWLKIGRLIRRPFGLILILLLYSLGFFLAFILLMLR
ncbi:glycosyltransferase [Entomospira nematocerorum]|uniref:Glycosyltransferase n=1 Tax=Entomospira nematocerorum TaxID=2719987 RepID=A0A968GFI2_9SPIO|nr:glycosyltransferase [Entomospira nematocera]NIZ47293.1 hypothetical protein [Entomospira nematocera]WDI34165.1 glycosyltransferase [Entomospira nematocera]